MPLRVRSCTALLLFCALVSAGAATPAAAAVLGAPVAVPAPAAVARAPGTMVVPPVPGPVVRVFVPPPSPYAAGHRGVDLAADPGDPVHSALRGVVAFAGRVAGAGWVSVDHGGGLRTTYGVLAWHAVRVGQRVEAGQVLGWLAGDRDHVDWGARLHGSYFDPLALLGRWRPHLVDPAGRPRLTAGAATGAAVGATGAAVTSTAVRLSPPGPRPLRLAWPVRGPLTSPFGPRRHPLSGALRPHHGVDLAAPPGAPVLAAAPGRVIAAGSRGGYGLVVVIDHGGGLVTLSAHLSAVRVTTGETVAAGQPIGAVGSTGAATGPHLHFEVRLQGVARDPLGWLA